jgi:hypothetical protein
MLLKGQNEGPSDGLISTVSVRISPWYRSFPGTAQLANQLNSILNDGPRRVGVYQGEACRSREILLVGAYFSSPCSRSTYFRLRGPFIHGNK